jgi:hypothetical protein
MLDLFDPTNFVYRPACLFPLASQYPNYPAWTFTAHHTWNRWAERYKEARRRRLAPSAGLCKKAGNLLREAYRTGICFWVWNALATFPPIRDHADLWRWCGNWSAYLRRVEEAGQRWQGQRDFFSLRVWDRNGGLEGKLCFTKKAGLWENDPLLIAPGSDASLLNAAAPLLSETEPSEEEWGSWHIRLFWLSFNRWQEPSKEPTSAAFFATLPPLTIDKQGFLHTLSELTWDFMRCLEGTNRPAERDIPDFDSMRRALDSVVRWCEPHLPKGLFDKSIREIPVERMIALLRWECGKARQLVEGLDYVQRKSGIPQDFGGAVQQIWEDAEWYVKPPRIPLQITNKAQALEAVALLENCKSGKPNGILGSPESNHSGSLERWTKAQNQNKKDQSAQQTRHSPDFRSVHWFGSNYTFTGTQAACVKILWQEWEKGTPEIGQETILEEAGTSGNRLIDVFRNRGFKTGYHPAWGNMIVPGSTKGAFRLNPKK